MPPQYGMRAAPYISMGNRLVAVACGKGDIASTWRIELQTRQRLSLRNESVSVLDGYRNSRLRTHAADGCHNRLVAIREGRDKDIDLVFPSSHDARKLNKC